jgi:hypothetical protein
MAANKATRLDPAFAAAVAEAQAALAAWRQRRKHREPIPERLWLDMARMARTYHPSPVAQALRVNYASLRRRALVHPEATPVADGGSFRL